MRQNCGKCNHQDEQRPGQGNIREFFCLFKNAWGPQYQDCEHFVWYSSMNREGRLAMALQARQNYEAEQRELRQKKETRESRREQRNFEVWIRIAFLVGGAILTILVQAIAKRLGLL